MKKPAFILLLSIISWGNITGMMEHSEHSYNPINHSEKIDLYKAAFSGDIEQVKSLLDKKVHVNNQDKNGNTPLHFAASKGHVEIVKLLLAHGATHIANNRHDSPWDIARKKQNCDVAVILQEHWVNYMGELL